MSFVAQTKNPFASLHSNAEIDSSTNVLVEGGSVCLAKDSSAVAHETPEGTVSQMQTALNLVVGGLGTGIFSLPWSLAGSSTLAGCATILGVIGLNIWTIMILVVAAERHQVFDLGSLLGKLPGRLGKGMQAVFNFFVIVSTFLCLMGYIITIHDCAAPFLEGTVVGSRLPIVAMGGLLVLPICFLDQKYLSFTSLVAVIVNLYIIGVVIQKFIATNIDDALPTGSCMLGFGKGNVSMMSAMMQCVIIQMCVLPMYRELENRTPARFRVSLTTAFVLLAILYCIFSVFGYMVFGPTVKSNALQSFETNVISQVAWIGTIFVVAAVYPILLLCILAPIHSLDDSVFGTGDVTSKRRLVIAVATVVIVVASVFGALLVTSLGFINVINGAMSVGIFTTLGPGLVGLYLVGRRNKKWQITMVVLIVVGFLMSIIGFAVTDNYYEDLEKSCLMGATA